MYKPYELLTPTSCTYSSHEWEAADVDNDGDLDFIMTNSNGGYGLVLMTNPGANSSFSLSAMTQSTITIGTSNKGPIDDISVADVDNDGDIDIIISFDDDGYFEVLTNDGSGSFTTAAQQDISAINPYGFTSNESISIDVADVDNDGYLDIGGAAYHTYAGAEYEVLRLSNTSPLTYTSYAFGDGSTPHSFSAKVKFVDFNGDGYQDIIYCANSDATYYVLGTSSGFESTFNSLTTTAPSPQYADPFIVDFDNDNQLEIVVPNQSNHRIYDWNGSSFTETTISTHSRFGHTFDVDGDGDMDFIGSDYFGIDASRNDGGVFQSGESVSGSVQYTGDSKLIDMNGDGYLDIVFTKRGGDNGLYYMEFQGTVPLPVELKHFRANCAASGAQLDWATAMEENNAGFQVERSANGRDFEALGWVAGAGTTLATSHYTFTDEAPLSGVNYYRLAQMDYDGTTTFSPIATTVCKSSGKAFEASQVAIYPNPADAHLTIDLPLTGVESLAIRNVLGQVVYTQHSPQGQQRLDISKWERGLYFMTLTSDQEQFSFRFIVR